MKETLRYGLILGLICVIASGLLATANALTKAKIVAQALAEEKASLMEVLPEADKFEPVKSGEDTLYYKARDKAGNLVGVAFKASAKGYSSPIDTVVGMINDGTIKAIKVVDQHETPGLGSRVSEPSFTGQFSGKGGALEGVQAITGATISSKAVIDSVKRKAEEVRGLIKDDK